MESVVKILSVIISEQGAILGIAVILLGIVVWLIKTLYSLLKESRIDNRESMKANSEMQQEWMKVTKELAIIIDKNTDATERLISLVEEEKQQARELYHKIISRPCIAHKE